MRLGIALAAIVLALVAGGALAWNTLQVPEPVEEQSPETTAELSPEEVQYILFMREEEKLARDVYLTLYDMWGLQIFKNIAESEQRHMDAVLTLIEKYGLEDPASDQVGVFTNETLQQLYDELVERGSQSIVDAILVGALIEEKDIIDINNLINATSNEDVIRVFQSLVAGSANHLKAFASQYEQVTGEAYTPQLLSLEKYQQTIENAQAGPDYNI